MKFADHEREAEIVIIGAGLLGLFVAYHLHKHGFSKIVIFDKGHGGGIASPRSGGLLRKHYNHPLLVRMAIHGDEQYSELSSVTGHDIGYTKNGYLLVVGAEKAGEVEKTVKLLRDLGVEIEVPSKSQAATSFPEFRNLGDDAFLAFEQNSAYARPPETIAALIDLNTKLGIKILEGTPVTGIDQKNGQVYGVETPYGTWKTETVVNCAGAWGASVGSFVGVDLPITVKRLLQIVEIQKQGNVRGVERTLSHDTADLYTRPNGDSRNLVGGRIYLKEATNPDSINLIANLDKVRELYESYKNMSTTSICQITNTWVGIDGDTTDYQPILGPINSVPGYYVATGFSAHGFKLGSV